MSRRVLLQWMHPVDGRQSEVLCSVHEGEVLEALKVLHIGCLSSALVDCKIRASLRGRRHRREQELYFCGGCNGFHLTSWTLRKAAS